MIENIEGSKQLYINQITTNGLGPMPICPFTLFIRTLVELLQLKVDGPTTFYVRKVYKKLCGIYIVSTLCDLFQATGEWCLLQGLSANNGLQIDNVN